MVFPNDGEVALFTFIVRSETVGWFVFVGAVSSGSFVGVFVWATQSFDFVDVDSSQFILAVVGVVVGDLFVFSEDLTGRWDLDDDDQQEEGSEDQVGNSQSLDVDEQSEH